MDADDADDDGTVVAREAEAEAEENADGPDLRRAEAVGKGEREEEGEAEEAVPSCSKRADSHDAELRRVCLAWPASIADRSQIPRSIYPMTQCGWII